MKIKGNRVWSKFSRNVNGKQVKLRVQELSEDNFEQVMDLFMKYHTPEEPLRVVSGVSDNPIALKEFRDIMLQIMIDEKQEVLVCCVDDDDSDDLQLIAASKMTLVERNTPKITHNFSVETVEMQDFFKLRNSLYATYDVFQENDTEKAYFADRGIVVAPEYRCLGISEELMLARAEMLKEHQVTMYYAMTTAIGSQKLAMKMGAKVVRELDLGEYVRNTGLPFNSGPITVKLIVGRVPS